VSNRPNVQYTELYRPGRLIVIFVAFFCIVIVYFCYLMMYKKTNMYFFVVLMFFPFILGIADAVLRKRLLPFGSLHGELAKRLKRLKTCWLLRKSGRGIRDLQRAENRFRLTKNRCRSIAKSEFRFD